MFPLEDDDPKDGCGQVVGHGALRPVGVQGFEVDAPALHDKLAERGFPGMALIHHNELPAAAARAIAKPVRVTFHGRIPFAIREIRLASSKATTWHLHVQSKRSGPRARWDRYSTTMPLTHTHVSHRKCRPLTMLLGNQETRSKASAPTHVCIPL